MDGAVPGLGIRVYPTGGKSWFLRYGPREARQRIVLGPFPALSLAAARNKARELVAGVKINGRDPMAERKAQRAARRKAETETFGALAACYLEEHAKRHKRSRCSPRGAPDRPQRSAGPMSAGCSNGSWKSGEASAPTAPAPWCPESSVAPPPSDRGRLDEASNY